MTVRIGIASLAHVHAESYVRLLRGEEDVELIVADFEGSAAEPAQRASRARIEAKGVRVVDTEDELFDARPDGIVICTANAEHRALTERAAHSHVHVLAEKPLATTREDAEAMVAACEEAGVGLMMAYPTRFSPAINELEAAIRRGDLGEVLACDGANIARIPTVDRSWFGDASLAGGGALMDHTVHLADILILLFGRPRKVYAQANTMIHAEKTRVDTGGIVCLDFGDGFVATIDASWSLPDDNPTWGGLSLRVTGTDAEMTADVFGGALAGHSGRTGQGIWRGYGADVNLLMLREFIDAIEEGRPPRPSGREGLDSLDVALAAYAAMRGGEPVAPTRAR